MLDGTDLHGTGKAPGLVGRHAYDVLVVGAGFAGAVMAERLASSGRRVLVIDQRPHIAGNAFDHLDDAGILIHRYGPHIFHTNAPDIAEYLGRFTAWRPYSHRVLAEHDGQLFPIPINRTTVNRFYGLDLAPDAVATFLARQAVPMTSVSTAADVVLSTVGPELFEAFFRHYTRKQWGLDPAQLDKSVTARIPTRNTDDDRYFTDTFQAMPRDGFTALFKAMLDHPLITVALGVSYESLRSSPVAPYTVFTGPVDAFFGYRYGPLPYRSLQFEHQTLDCATYQPVGVVNHPGPMTPYTRTTEFKHLTGQVHARTSICRELPSASGDPYYPIPRPENAVLYAKYRDLADARPDVTFVGRLATYRYYNMDQVVGQALAAFRRLEADKDRLPAPRAAIGAT